MNMGLGTLDDLLGTAEPNGTFHDADLLTAKVDKVNRVVFLELNLCVGDPESDEHVERERRRRGALRVEGLNFWVLEPPLNEANFNDASHWITSDGPLSECPSSLAKDLLPRVAKDEEAWYLYFNDSNSFCFLAGRRAVFEWK